jgi:uncharacterized protein
MVWRKKSVLLSSEQWESWQAWMGTMNALWDEIRRDIKEMRTEIRLMADGNTRRYNPRRVAAGIKAAQTRKYKAAVKETVLNGLDSKTVGSSGEG